MNVGGVNYRTCGMLKIDKFWIQTTTASLFWGHLFFFCDNE